MITQHDLTRPSLLPLLRDKWIRHTSQSYVQPLVSAYTPSCFNSEENRCRFTCFIKAIDACYFANTRVCRFKFTNITSNTGHGTRREQRRLHICWGFTARPGRPGTTRILGERDDEQQKSGKYYIVGALQRCMPSFKVFNTLHCTMLSLSGYL